MSKRISRRRFIGASALTSAALLARAAEPAATAPLPPPNPRAGAWARWLDGRAPPVTTGATWGMPWPRGKHPARTQFVLQDADGSRFQVQSWPLGYWPDGSLKWTAHATPASANLGAGPFEVVPARATTARAAALATPLTVEESDSAIEIDTGLITCRLSRSGATFISSITRNGRELVRNGRLVLLRQDRASADTDAVITHETFQSTVDRIAIEQRGPIRAVVRIEGRHKNVTGRHWLPFTLRLYFYAGGEALRVLHTFVFDGDESRDFIRGIGLRFDVTAQRCASRSPRPLLRGK